MDGLRQRAVYDLDVDGCAWEGNGGMRRYGVISIADVVDGSLAFV